MIETRLLIYYSIIYPLQGVIPGPRVFTVGKILYFKWCNRGRTNKTHPDRGRWAASLHSFQLKCWLSNCGRKITPTNSLYCVFCSTKGLPIPSVPKRILQGLYRRAGAFWTVWCTEGPAKHHEQLWSTHFYHTHLIQFVWLILPSKGRLNYNLTSLSMNTDSSQWSGLWWEFLHSIEGGLSASTHGSALQWLWRKLSGQSQGFRGQVWYTWRLGP